MCFGAKPYELKQALDLGFDQERVNLSARQQALRVQQQAHSALRKVSAANLSLPALLSAGEPIQTTVGKIVDMMVLHGC